MTGVVQRRSGSDRTDEVAVGETHVKFLPILASLLIVLGLAGLVNGAITQRWTTSEAAVSPLPAVAPAANAPFQQIDFSLMKENFLDVSPLACILAIASAAILVVGTFLLERARDR